MGLADGTAIVTADEVAEITHEPELENLDDGDATIEAATRWATTWIMDELDARGIPCAKIANPERLKRCAAYVAAAHALRGSGLGDEAEARATGYLDTARELLAKYRFVSSDAPSTGTTNLLLPMSGNQDDLPTFGPRTGAWDPPPPFCP